MISFLNLGSGSKGNATLVYCEDTLLLIDAGLAKCKIACGLKKIGREFSDIAAVLITHNHTDHVSGLKPFVGRAPIYAGADAIEEDHIHASPYETFNVGSFSITPLQTSHDANSPLGYLLKDRDQSLLYMTDTGIVPADDLAYMSNCDYYIFESNHDLGMLMASKRPWPLKKRIAGPCGHLSNADSASILSKLIGPCTKAIYLAHLSEECNAPQLAVDAYVKAFHEANIDFPSSSIIPLKQREETFGGHR